MVNRYYQPGAGRAEKVGDLFATIAPRYDLVNDLQSLWLHRAWKRRLVRLAAPQTAERALDLCCGTGDIAFALARSGANVVGLDFSEPMLAVARARAKVRESNGDSSNPQFIQGDAQQIPYPENTFELVTIGYGLRNLANWQLGLEEMRRVVKPGGRLLVLDFGKPENPLWRGVYFGYLRWLLPVFGRIVCRNSEAYAYIFESLKNYPAQRGIASKMQALNCGEARTINLLGGVMSISYGRKAEGGILQR